MNSKRHPARLFGVLLSSALAAVVLATGCQGMISREPPIHLNPNMDQQGYYEPQEANPMFADGSSSRAPVPGVVAWGMDAAKPDPLYRKADDHLYRGLKDGQLAESLPPQILLDRALLERGKERFEIYCLPCHGGTGHGDGIIGKRGMTVPPSNFHDERLRGMPIGHFYQVISNGVRNMAAYGSQIPVEDRWAIAAYVRVLQRAQHASLSEVPPETARANGWQ